MITYHSTHISHRSYSRYIKRRGKRDNKKIIEKRMDTIVSRAINKNPMGNSRLEGLFIQEAIINAGDQAKRVVLFEERHLLTALSIVYRAKAWWSNG